MISFQRYQRWQKWLKEIPALNDSMNGIIARSFILTKGNLEEVEFVTGASKQDIFKVYEWLSEKKLIDGLISLEKEDEDKGEIEHMAVVAKGKKKKERTFTREEMVDYAKKKLLEANKGISFVSLKHNVLTCEYEGRTFKVYISSSRDYESFRKGLDYEPYRVSAWNKGSQEMFSSCDYYALLVKVDKNTKYITEYEDNIEGMFVNQEELNKWLSQKVAVPSGMINFYVHYSQSKDEGRNSITVIDDREEPALSLNHLYQKGWSII
ncbi:hypothetical protein [Terrihalobacillus insolitus]|uniref:hypothetical protein n=1 Tax=Terrihalobacillus insolitus TaxID=2950438 RepID=UPI0023415DD5|nr:hypothetical protein [Terrihalobacillus insolitus]MDC3414782.1 hypothetical protein [Terrihalobacillus insolitus]